MGGVQRPQDVTIVSVPARMPAGVDRLDVLVDGLPVGDLHLRLCAACERAVIEHVRVDRRYRERGLARRLVEAATEDRSGWSWSTTEIDDNAAARAFAAVGIWPGPPRPRWCAHMRFADDLMP